MAQPTLVFRNVADTIDLPQAGTLYFDWNATDGAGGSSDTPNPLVPNSIGNYQYVRLKNIATAMSASASYIKFYIDGVDASQLASLNYLRVSQGGSVQTITSARGTNYNNGIPLAVGSGTNGDVLTAGGISQTITLFVVTTATGINANSWNFVAGYYYVP